MIAVGLWMLLDACAFWLFREPRGAPGPAEPPLEIDAAGARRVLFLGNSFTFANGMPEMLARIAQAKGRPVVTRMLAPGGYALEQHLASAQTRRELEAQPWDIVVVQEQSQRPSFDEAQVEREVLAPGVALDKLIHELAPHATTVLYETWGYRDGDRSNCAKVPAVCTYDGMQARLVGSYVELGKRTGAVVAPVGLAWQATRRGHPEVELYAPDGAHPSREGSYLAACVLFATLFAESPGGGAVMGLDPRVASLLQSQATSTVLGYEERHSAVP